MPANQSWRPRPEERSGRTVRPAGQLGTKVIRACRQRGLITRFREDIVMLAPPLVIRESELDEVTTTLREAIAEVAG